MKVTEFGFVLLLRGILAINSTLKSSNEQNSTIPLQSSVSRVDSCASKIRTISGVDPNFRSNIDRIAQTAQYDAIDKLLRNKEEIRAMTEFLDEERASTEIIQLVALNMTKDEKDFVNIMEHSHNLAALRDFYLRKYESLPYDQYKMLRKSYNKVLNKFVNSNLKENIAQFLNALTSSDSNKLRAYGMLSEEGKLVALIDEKIAATNFTDIDRREIQHYLKGLFMSLKPD
uniref:Fatty-acid and retinol-binding protein 1 n=1 Tax=Elaeophora elaphi TaxID=1147741 RepID=A0A0R3RQ30_9BILA